MGDFKPVLTGQVGTNAELIAEVCRLYLSPDETGKRKQVYDVTWGKGVFWKNVDLSKFTFFATDMNTSAPNGKADFRCLPYDEGTGDVLVLDPPYMHGGATVKASINKCYQNQNTSHESVIRLYTAGILEAARVLRKGGQVWLKCQDEIESGKQRGSYRELCGVLEVLGFSITDTFVLVQDGIPAMRENYQKTARKNHSYLIIATYRR